jgi:hypothetical protein
MPRFGFGAPKFAILPLIAATCSCASADNLTMAQAPEAATQDANVTPSSDAPAANSTAGDAETANPSAADAGAGFAAAPDAAPSALDTAAADAAAPETSVPDSAADPAGAVATKACWTQADCPAGHACWRDQCSGPGACKPKPEACDDVYAPLCGCDGTTYANKCALLQAGTGKIHDGPCANAAACKIGGAVPACGDKGYCATAKPGTCGGLGTCAPKPGVCTKDANPVCGCNGKTYANPCHAAAAGQNIAAKGACKLAGGCTVGQPESCPDGHFCKASSDFQCSGSGACVAVPQVCPLVMTPVCGCDGKSYGNACEAAAKGQNVQQKGTCEL